VRGKGGKEDSTVNKRPERRSKNNLARVFFSIVQDKGRKLKRAGVLLYTNRRKDMQKQPRKTLPPYKQVGWESTPRDERKHTEWVVSRGERKKTWKRSGVKRGPGAARHPKEGAKVCQGQEDPTEYAYLVPKVITNGGKSRGMSRSRLTTKPGPSI